jgi:phosphoribosyl 1,2-cyclic phosphodiesterase
MTVVVRMVMVTPVAVIVCVHPLYSTSFPFSAQHARLWPLWESMTPSVRDFVDAATRDCHYQKWSEVSGEEPFIACNPAAPQAEMSNPVAKLSFWGVRGSTPTVDPATWRYGGNTPCLELVAPDGSQMILDCGTGLRMLGSRWGSADVADPPEAHIFVTHYHWDHIQGLPFFSPLYVEKNRFQFYSFRSKFLGRDSLKQVFEAQMALPYFPVDFSAMSARRRFREVDGGESFMIGENKITARWLNHPQGCLGFRIETPAGTVAYATDNEPGDPKLDKSLRELAAEADIFINDAQFSPSQLATTRKGWGHSSWREGVSAARDANAKTLVLFHHDPDSTDRMVDDLLHQARNEFDSVFAASEGMVITLGAANEPVQAHMPGSRTALRREAQFRACVSGVTAEGQKFQEETFVRDLSIQGALVSLKHSPRMQSELQVTMETPGTNGIQEMRLRGYVVRIEQGAEKGTTAVGVVFTD